MSDLDGARQLFAMSDGLRQAQANALGPFWCVVTVDENEPIANGAALLKESAIKRVPVRSRGQMVGIVSGANLRAALAQMKE